MKPEEIGPIRWTMPNSEMNTMIDDLFSHFMKGWREQGMTDQDISEHIQRTSDEFFKKKSSVLE